eukprot:9438556-Ditylum_brightwellii.AAC.1
MAQRNPQAVHTGFSQSLQHEWAYLQRVIEVDPEKYDILDSVIQAELIPVLFDADNVPEEFDQLFQLPVKQAGLGILSPSKECTLNHCSSLESTQHLVGAILHDIELNLQEHDHVMNKERQDGKKRKDEKYKNIVHEVCTPLSPGLHQGLEEREKEGGDWLNMVLRYKNNNMLGQ